MNVDRLIHAWQGRLTGGLSPSSLMLASLDWAVHLASSPERQLELIDKAVRKAGQLGAYASQQALGAGTPPCIEPLPQDRRFDDPAWQQWPFALTCQAFLLIQQWWHNATTGVEGVSQHHADVITFAARHRARPRRTVASGLQAAPDHQADVTFLLTSGGHNAGIVLPPGHPRRSYQMATHRGGLRHRDPDTWQQAMPVHQGSWWPTWQAWLQERSSEQVPPPDAGKPGAHFSPIADAPGRYVHER